MKQAWQQYLQIIQQVVKPALGCTEPIAAAYAAAVAARQLGCKPVRLEVVVSDNLYKNSMGVYVPGTGKIGLAIAAAAGAIGGNAEAGLEVLAAITPAQVAEAQELIDAGQVQVSRTSAPEFIYCRVRLLGLDAEGTEHSAEVTLCGGHTRIVEQRRNDEVTFTAEQGQGGATGAICDGVDISIAAIYEFATQVEFEQIRFILQASELNGKLSDEGMNNPYGLEIGRTMQQNIQAGLIGEDVMNRIVMRTAAASDARMGGASLPAMSNFGSGNQGIAATIPVVVIAERFGASEEQLARALIDEPPGGHLHQVPLSTAVGLLRQHGHQRGGRHGHGLPGGRQFRAILPRYPERAERQRRHGVRRRQGLLRHEGEHLFRGGGARLSDGAQQPCGVGAGDRGGQRGADHSQRGPDGQRRHVCHRQHHY